MLLVALEVGGSFGECFVGHKVLTIDHLGSLLHQSIFEGLNEIALHLVVGLFVPVDLEFCDAGLFRQNVPVESGNIRCSGMIINHFLIIVFDVHIITNSQKLLVIFV